MSQRSPRKRIEGSDYEDKWSQRADDVKGMSNRGKRKVSPRKERIGVNRNRKGVDSSQRRGSAVFQIDFEIVFTMWS